MNSEQKKSDEKKCGESCGCHEQQESNKDAQILNLTTTTVKKEPQTEEDKLSPTRFGDWELKGRAIDF